MGQGKAYFLKRKEEKWDFQKNKGKTGCYSTAKAKTGAIDYIKWSYDCKRKEGAFRNHSSKTGVYATSGPDMYRDLWNIFGGNPRKQRNFCFSSENF